MRDDGKTGHRIPKGKKYSGDEVVVLARRVHNWLKRETPTRKVRVQATEEPFFFSNMLLTGEAIFGTDECFSQLWNGTQTPSTSTLGVQKGVGRWSRTNLGTRIIQQKI